MTGIINKITISPSRYVSVIIAVVLVFSAFINVFNGPVTHAFPKGMLFPIIGGGSFSDTYYAYRSLNGVHRATDIFAPKHTPIVSAVDGTISYVGYPQDKWGYDVEITDPEGFTYIYLHINNDTPGTDDGNGGPMNAYAPDIPEGAKVKRGQLIGYLGDSGNAETTPPHLHLEILDSKGGAIQNYNDMPRINPYPYLLEAVIPTRPDIDYPPVKNTEILPYGVAVRTQSRIATGIFDNTDETKLVVATGKGYSPHVRILNENGTEVSGFYAYDPSFTGGVDVATGDVDGDGIDEVITGTQSGAPHVRILDKSGVDKGGFYAYSPSFTGGVNVSSIDINGDGIDEILVGAGPTGGPHVRVLDKNGVEKAGFFAYAPSFTGGVDVASGDVTGDSAKEIVTTPGPGGSAHVRIFTSQGVATGAGFSAYDNFTGGARVSVGNVRTSTAKDEILVSPWQSGAPHIRLLTATGSSVREGYYYEQWWNGNYEVAAGEDTSYVTTGGNRRTSVRPGPS